MLPLGLTPRYRTKNELRTPTQFDVIDLTSSSDLFVVFLIYEDVILDEAVHHCVKLGVRSVHQRR